jgi:hypothetical protein
MSKCMTDNGESGAGLSTSPSKILLDRSELIGILEEHLAVTDEWGGCKLASWQWGNNVVVDGIDEAADAILSRLSNHVGKVEMKTEIYEYVWRESSVSVYDNGSISIELSDCAHTSLCGEIDADAARQLYNALKSVFESTADER